MHCRTVATVTAVELLTITTIPRDAHPAGGRVSCELAAGHRGSHVAFAAAASDGDHWWWLRWDSPSGEVTELVQIDPCAAKLPQGRYADDCVLPEGHPGPHSFDLSARPALFGKRHRVPLRFLHPVRRDARRDIG